MDNHLRVLMVEDSESDAALIVRQLQKANYIVEYERVETSNRMEAALADRSWDFIFSDYTMPQFDAFSALKILQETGQDIPFIVISGTIGEETAVEIMRSGAHDYLMKDKLARLAPVVKREIDETRARKERRLTERALRESEARIRALVETARDVIFTLTPDGKITTLNPSFQALTGWPTTEWIGRPFEGLLVPEDVPKALERIRKIIAGEPGRVTELRIQTKDRGVIHTELITTQHLQNGELIELLGIARDITERKEVEYTLQNKEALLSDAMRIARLGPWSHDLATDTFTFNDHFYAIYRTTAEQVGGYTMSSAEYLRRFVHPDDAAIVGAEIRKSVENPDSLLSHRLEHRMLYADGEIGYLDVTIFVVKDEKGRTIRTRGVNQDITERKKSEEQLRQSEERYRQFFEDDLTGDFISTVDGRILSCNPAFARIYGFDSVEEAMQMSTESFYLTRQDRENFLNLIREKRKLEYYEEVAKKKDGKTIYLVSNEIGIFNERDELGTDKRVYLRRYRTSITRRSVTPIAKNGKHRYAGWRYRTRL